MQVHSGVIFDTSLEQWILTMAGEGRSWLPGTPIMSRDNFGCHDGEELGWGATGI